MYEIEEGQVYEESRESRVSEYKVVFCNEHVVLLQHERNNHRLEARDYFENCIDIGHFEIKNGESKPIERASDSSESLSESSQEIPYEDIPWVGESSANSLRSSDFVCVEDIKAVSDSRLLECNSVGERSVEEIRKWVKNHE